MANQNEEQCKTKKGIKFPDAYIIVILIIIFCACLTWVVPAGNFQRIHNDALNRDVVVAGSFALAKESTPVGPWEVVKTLYDGIVSAANIIFFIFIAAAYVYMLMRTGALNALTGWLLRMLGKRDYLIIPVFMLLFGLAGTTFGMYEETYGLIPAFIVIALTLGYDRVVGGAIIFVGVATGFAAGTLNPFTIGIASAVAQVPLAAPKVLTIRIISFVLFMSLSILYTMRYANKIRKDPTKSVMYGDPDAMRGMDSVTSRDDVMNTPFTNQQKLSLIGFALLIIILAYSVIAWGWYLSELASLFIVFMVITGVINRMDCNQIAEVFVEGCKSVMYGALLVGLARSVSLVMEEGNIIDTAIFYFGNIISMLPKSLAGIGMLTVQNIIGFFITSGSGMAVVTMPIMAPLADVVGLSREVAVLAFQFGDGFTNMFWPTAVATECGIMGISLVRWYKFITPLFIMMFILQAIVIVAAIMWGV